ncbi:hypothetical protein FJZ39_02265 [Candidatus Saccharibacteria bacterium]|nr:hypothetical protein [Candidatus Saccharibacteria bacterium]
MDTVTLERDGITATIALEGAYVTSLSDRSEPILYEKRTIIMANGEQKVRGGMHVCLPQFGPGGTQTSLAQHGFGRTLMWRIVDSAPQYVTLRLHDTLPQEYHALQAEITYQLTDSHEFKATLTLQNTQHSLLRVAPGFHPYFYTNGERVEVDREVMYLEELDPAHFKRSVQYLTLQERKIALASPKLGVWALWSDNKGEYVCLEPTLAGFSFQNHQESLPEEELQPHASRSYDFTFSWR